MTEPNSIRVILVDDEERALNALSLLLSQECPQVEIIARCRNVPEAVLAINKQKPDLVFLDIEMPEYNGFELLGFFREIDFQIIFVSAYSEYAIRAFEVSATDYLLKPVDTRQLKVAVEKASSRLKVSDMYERLELLQKAYRGEELSKIALPMLDGLLFVDVREIVYLQADGAYTTLFKTDGSKIVISKKLKFFEAALASNSHFFRVHRSSLINISQLLKYNRGANELVMDNGDTIQLSRDRKHDFEQSLKLIHKQV